MSKNYLISDEKKLAADIRAGYNREENLTRWQKVLAEAYAQYAVIRLSLNLYTLQERIQDTEDQKRKNQLNNWYEKIREAVQAVLTEGDVSALPSIQKIREEVTAEMQVLTAYTDAFEIYEYILNRVEAKVKNLTVEAFDPDDLAEQMYQFVFSEKDKVLINTRIQSLVAQLPVRLSKQRFYDILSGTLSLYQGGEKKALKDFTDTIREAALIKKPEGFGETFRDLYDIYGKLSSADYRNLSPEEYDVLTGLLKDATGQMEGISGDDTLLMEVLNDVLILLMMEPMNEHHYPSEAADTAGKLLRNLTSPVKDTEKDVSMLFADLEGMQEEAFHTLSSAAGNLEEFRKAYQKDAGPDTAKRFEDLRKADLLTSSSLFMDIQEIPEEEAEDAGENAVESAKAELIQDFTDLFQKTDKLTQRSIMAKVLSMMPVFFNTQQEIKDYFVFALNSCSNPSELAACEKIIKDMMLRG